jgi:D-alanine-D-alanine ligase
MNIGITYTMRQESSSLPSGEFSRDDHEEEFDSPETIEAIADVIRGLGHEVELLGDGEALLRRLLEGPAPDLVFNLAEGRGSGRCREARVPAVLEMLDIPYTGSDALTLSATLDKECAKRLAAHAGVATPAWVVFEGDLRSQRDSVARLKFPVFVKPAYEGSSKGILDSSLIRNAGQLLDALPRLYAAYCQPILIEEFIDGDELTIGLVGNPPQVLGIMRVLPQRAQGGPFVYSLEVKRDWENRVRYECPAQLAPEDTAAVEAAAIKCWRALGCRDVSRFDFRLRAGVPFFLEVNPLPGLSPMTGDLAILANLAGIDYPELIERIIAAATVRQRGGSRIRNKNLAATM